MANTRRRRDTYAAVTHRTAAQLIADLRAKNPPLAELTQEELAVTLRIPVRTLQRWETEDDPNKGPSWSYSIPLMMLAGWLTPGEGDEDATARLQASLADALQRQRQVGLRDQAQPPARHRRNGTRRRKPAA